MSEIELTEEQIDKEEESDFLAGFGEEEEKEPEGAVAEQSDTEEPEGEEEDPAESVLERRLRTMEGKYGNLNHNLKGISSSLDELKAAQNAARVQVEQSGGEAPSSEQIRESLKDSEKLQVLKDEFPEWADAMDEQSTIVESRISQKMFTKEEVKAELNGIKEEFKREVEDLKAYNKVSRVHPDWEMTAATDEFRHWRDVQPVEVQRLAASDDPDDAIDMLNKYAAFTAERDKAANAEKKKRDRLTSAVTPTSAGVRPRGESQSDEEAFLAGFNS